MHGIWLGLVAAIALIVIGQYLYLALTVDWHVAARDAQLRAQQKADGRDGIDLSKHDEHLARHRANGEDGVGLAAADSAKVHIRDTSFSGNAAREGGALHMRQTSCDLAQIIVSGNTASDNGGGMLVRESTLAISGTSAASTDISSNTAGSAGGGIYLDTTVATLSHVSLRENRAGGDER